MRTVWKYELAIDDYIDVEIPKGAEILTFQIQSDKPCIWCLVDPNVEKETRRFRLAGTGHDIKEDNLKYIGSCQVHEGVLIFHLFEILDKQIKLQKEVKK